MRRRLAAGEWVVDLRTGSRSPPGTWPARSTSRLDGKFATYLAWMIPWGKPVTLIADSAGQVARAQRELVRVGIDRRPRRATGTVEQLAGRRGSSCFPGLHFAGLAASWSSAGRVVLDVRRADEAGRALAGAVHIPFHELHGRSGEVPAGTVWVHCAGGLRAAIAASLLDRAGRQVVHVDDDWERAARLGLPVTVEG